MRLLLTILTLAFCLGGSSPLMAAAEKPAAAIAAPAAPAENILATASEAGYTLKLIADREAFSLESPFLLTLRLEGPADSKLASMDLTKERLAEAFDVKALPETALSEGLLAEQRFQLDPWIAEKYVLPAVTAEVVDAGGQSHRIATSAIELAVSQPDDSYWQSLDVASSGKLQRSLTPGADRRNRIIAAIAAVAIAAAASFAIRAWRRRRKAEAAARIPEIPPYEQASAALEELLHQELLRQGETKRYYTGLSDILRKYIERRFALSAPRQTTQEFIAAVASGDAGALKQYASLLREFLMACDMVKFAKATPLANEGEAAARTCRQFLEATRPAQETDSAQQSHAPSSRN